MILVDIIAVVRWEDLGFSPIALDLGFFKLRWYSLAYLFGILFGWWYLIRMISLPGSPMAKRHIDDFVIYATLGVILGGRVGYCLFYRPEIFFTPLEVLKLWEGGMSFHGGVLGVVIALIIFCKKNDLNFVRVCDYVACVYPMGHLLGRLANFSNGELWGKEADLPWAMVFPGAGEVARHPSQLYEAGLEGLLLGCILWVLFWKTNARQLPGLLVGSFTLLMGVFRFIIEMVREPDEGVAGLLGMSMGQTLCIPMFIVGGYLIFVAKKRNLSTISKPVAEAERTH